MPSQPNLYKICPLCFSSLSVERRPESGEVYWYCSNCESEWTVEGMLAIINSEEED